MNERDNEECHDRYTHGLLDNPGDCRAWGERHGTDMGEDNWFVCPSCRKFYAQPDG